jgi:hypothetical protein
LDDPVVLYRCLNGEPVALSGHCPHRHFPLARGKPVGNELQWLSRDTFRIGWALRARSHAGLRTGRLQCASLSSRGLRPMDLDLARRSVAGRPAVDSRCRTQHCRRSGDRMSRKTPTAPLEATLRAFNLQTNSTTN